MTRTRYLTSSVLPQTTPVLRDCSLPHPSDNLNRPTRWRMQNPTMDPIFPSSPGGHIVAGGERQVRFATVEAATTGPPAGVLTSTLQGVPRSAAIPES
jgi:hypothetical protein